MNFLPPILRSSLAYSLLCGVLATAIISCDKESNTDALRRKYPIPTELPEASCEGANTVGARFDSIVFVANYFPNTSSWGSPTPEDGVRAFIDPKYPDYIDVIGLHPIRPEEIDNRRMTFVLRYYHQIDSIGFINFIYSGSEIEFSIRANNISLNLSNGISFDPIDSTLCGPLAPINLIEFGTTRDIGDPDIYDTIIMRDFRIDVPVHLGRY